ncbi:MAG TPA: hypothetical protein VN853_05990 [Polyangia bacterium]|nr:hypothetical protein [Polyangia bacterium]
MRATYQSRADQGRRPRPAEARQTVLRTCEAGLRARSPGERATPEQALGVLAETPAEVLFRRGFS